MRTVCYTKYKDMTRQKGLARTLMAGIFLPSTSRGLLWADDLLRHGERGVQIQGTI